MEIIKNLPAADYFARPAVSKSALSDLKASPGRYYQRHIAKTLHFTPSENMRLGTAMHTMLLEPEKYADEILVMPDFPRKSKAQPLSVSEQKSRFMDDAKANGQTVITADQAAIVAAASKAIKGNEYLEAEGDAELSIFWQDEATGLECKARLDKWLPEQRIIVDYKTTVNAAPSGFARQILNFDYHLQAASYLRGAEAVGLEPRLFVFVAQEMVEPYLSGTYILDDDSIRSGLIDYKELMQELADRLESNNWPTGGSHVAGLTQLRIPGWGIRSII